MPDRTKSSPHKDRALTNDHADQHNFTGKIANQPRCSCCTSNLSRFRVSLTLANNSSSYLHSGTLAGLEPSNFQDSTDRRFNCISFNSLQAIFGSLNGFSGCEASLAETWRFAFKQRAQFCRREADPHIKGAELAVDGARFVKAHLVD